MRPGEAPGCTSPPVFGQIRCVCGGGGGSEVVERREMDFPEIITKSLEAFHRVGSS